ncbi:hypothetical protein HK096_006437, partial [Nowakowskiella sp. JEL0078]
MRIDVNLVSNVLDTPDIFWSEPWHEKNYTVARTYLEISQRVEVLNQRVGVISDLLDMLKEHQSSYHGESLEWIVIWLITIEIIVVREYFDLKPLRTVNYFRNKGDLSFNLFEFNSNSVNPSIQESNIKDKKELSPPSSKHEIEITPENIVINGEQRTIQQDKLLQSIGDGCENDIEDSLIRFHNLLKEGQLHLKFASKDAIDKLISNIEQSHMRDNMKLIFAESLFNQLKINKRIHWVFFVFLLKQYSEYGLLNKFELLVQSAKKFRININPITILDLRLKCSVVNGDVDNISSAVDDLRKVATVHPHKPFMTLFRTYNRTVYHSSQNITQFEEMFVKFGDTMKLLGKPVPQEAYERFYFHLENTHQYSRILEFRQQNPNVSTPEHVILNALIETHRLDEAKALLDTIATKSRKLPPYTLKLAAQITIPFLQVHDFSTRVEKQSKYQYLAPAIMKAFRVSTSRELVAMLKNAQISKYERKLLINELKISFAYLADAGTVKLLAKEFESDNFDFLTDKVYSVPNFVNKSSKFWALDPKIIRQVQHRLPLLSSSELSGKASSALDLLKHFDNDLKKHLKSDHSL